MKKTGAQLAVYALEQVGIRRTFGIPGVHNTELYDELNRSDKIIPTLVTHEMGGAFMADAISRTTESVGCLVIVPAAGMTHALSGIGEAYLAGIPMLVISGGIRTDSGRAYQLHDIDQHRVLNGITKWSRKVESHEEIVPAIFEGYQRAVDGEPGPVFIEIPVNIQLFRDTVSELPKFTWQKKIAPPDEDLLDQAAGMLAEADQPGLFLGWGASGAKDQFVELAERLEMPVATSLQGLGVFPGDHPLHTGMGIGGYAVPAAELAFEGCDLLLAAGVRFGEIATGSYGLEMPERLIHIDINPEVFHKNYRADIAIEGDAAAVADRLLGLLDRPDSADARGDRIRRTISDAKQNYRAEWEKESSPDRVNPALFFSKLRKQLNDDAVVTVDDGNHTYLAAELFEVRKQGMFISPTDFNCMGYCVPAAIGAKLASPERQVVGIAGDGAFIMTGMELLTAAEHQAGVVIFIFNDGELSQISQGQQLSYNRKVCSKLGRVDFQGMAAATGSGYMQLENNGEIKEVVSQALRRAEGGEPVIVDVMIDYTKKTRFTRGIVKTNLGRFPVKEKLRFVGRAVKRKFTG